MTEEEIKITKRAVSNIIMSMIKSHDAPASAEMHLMESVVDLARIVNIKDFEDSEMNEHFQSCQEVMTDVRSLLYPVKNLKD